MGLGGASNAVILTTAATFAHSIALALHAAGVALMKRRAAFVANSAGYRQGIIKADAGRIVWQHDGEISTETDTINAGEFKAEFASWHFANGADQFNCLAVFVAEVLCCCAHGVMNNLTLGYCNNEVNYF